MATNIEIKARVGDLDKLRELVEELSDTPCEVVVQEDTFFHTPRGRLKLRVLAPGSGQLIYYEREDSAGPKRSEYILTATSEPSSLMAALAASLGVRGVVRKERTVYKAGNTRIHLDKVEGVGAFVELEVVLGGDEGVEEGEGKAVELMGRLGIDARDLVQVAYIDLLEGDTA